MKPETCSYIQRTTYCSKDCYKRYVKKFIWNYYGKLIKKEFKSLMFHLYKFLGLIYKCYIKDFLNTILKISIILIAYFSLSTIIYLVETYIN